MEIGLFLSKFVFKTIATNIILAFITFLFSFFLIKKHAHPSIILVLLLMLPLYSLFNLGTYESGDLTLNVVKGMTFYQSISEGQWIPNWAGELNATYGYPQFIFTYPLPYYLISLFHFLNFNFIASVKLVMGTSFLLSGIAFYYYCQTKFTPLVALISTLFYAFAPYHLIDLHYRVALGELMSFIFLPLALKQADYLLAKNHTRSGILLSLFIALLILSHQATALVFLPILGLYCLLSSGKPHINNLVHAIWWFVLGFGLASWYWLPVLTESQYTLQPLYNKTVEFWPFISYIISPWRYGWQFQGPSGQLTFPVGYIHLPLILISSYLVIKNKFRFPWNYWLGVTVILFILMQKMASPLWQIIPLISNLQFSYRLLVVITFSSTLLIGFGLEKMKRFQSHILILSVLAISSSITIWNNRALVPEFNDQAIRTWLPLSTAAGEGLQPAAPKWNNPNNPWQSTIPDRHIEILKGQGSIQLIHRSSILHTYDIDSSTELLLKENTLYFPGWSARIDGNVTKIDYENSEYRGKMLLKSPPGKHTLEICFSDTPIRSLSKQISLISMFLIIFLTILSRHPTTNQS